MTWPRTIKKGNASVKVYRVKHETNRTGWAFVLVWQTAEGRKKQKFADEAAALEEAGLKAKQLNAGQIDAASMTSEDRAELAAARELAGDTPLLVALREWRTARDKASPSTHKALVEDVVAKFYAQKQSVGVDTTAGYDRTLPRFRDHFQGRALESLGLAELDGYLGQFANANSRNSHRQRIVTLFRWARKRNYLPLDTLTAAERTDTVRAKHVQIGLVTPAELARSYVEVRRAKPEYEPALILASACGLRRAEVHAQTWDDIDLDRAFLRVSKAKPRTPARRMVPIPTAAVARLRAYRPDTTKGPICTNLAIDRIRDICRTSGLDLADNGFRHSWISARVAVTGNVNETSIEAGNTPSVLHRHYRELMRKDEAEAWFALPTQPPPL
jgi:integrase